MGRTLLLATVLVVAAILAWFEERPPSPRPADAAPNLFSADRALPDVRVIARTAHPVGSPENARVRDYLLRRMTDLGLSPQVQRAPAFEAQTVNGVRYVSGGTVENLVGVLPGQNRIAPAVAIMAHYDSVPGSPGAADDATGVAAALEAVRALKTQGAPSRDLIVLITDGEEAGLLGAHAFFEQHPLARRVGFVLNMEARGGGGRVQMFQTGPEAGETMALFQRSAVRPSATSLSAFVYDKMPNDTDFSVSKAARIPGLNYAFIGRQFDYHSPTSTTANLDKRSLQHMGEQVLSATRAAVYAPALPKPAPDLVYSDVFAGQMIAYRAEIGWAVLGGAAVLLLLAYVRARGLGAISGLEVGRGAAAGLFVLLGSGALLDFARRATGVSFGFLEQRQLLAQVTLFETTLVVIALGFLLVCVVAAAHGRRVVALIPLVAGAGASAFGGFDPVGLGLGGAAAVLGFVAFWRPNRIAGTWAGVLAVALVLGVILQALAPAVAFAIAWPLTLAAVAAAATAFGARRAGVVLAILALWPLLFAARLAHGLYLGLDAPAALAAPLWIAALALWPLAHPDADSRATRLPAAGLLLVGAGLLIFVRLNDPWSARHPDVAAVYYLVDQDLGRSFRVSATPHSNAWIDQVLTADGGVIAKRSLRPLYTRRVDAAPAASAAGAPPDVTLVRQPDGGLLLSVAPRADTRLVAVSLKATVPLQASLNGRPTGLLEKAGVESNLRWSTSEPVTLRLLAPGPGRIEIAYATVSPGWPAQAKPLPQRPATVSAFGLSDSTIVKGSRRFTW